MNERRESVLAWTGTIVAVLYFAWRGATIFRVTRVLEGMFEGLGAQLPAATRLAVAQRPAILAVVFGLPIVVVIGKEFLVRDKRTSMMITMLIVILVLFAVDVLVTVYYMPLFDLIGKLS